MKKPIKNLSSPKTLGAPQTNARHRTVVFCKITQQEELPLPHILAAHRQLIALAKGAESQPGVYGRIYFLDDPDTALEHAVKVVRSMADQGFQVSVGLAEGNVFRTTDMGLSVHRGDCISHAARLASMKPTAGCVMIDAAICDPVTPAVTRLKLKLSSWSTKKAKHGVPYRFRSVQVTKLIKSDRSSSKSPNGVRAGQRGHVVVYDLAGFSRGDNSEQHGQVGRLESCLASVSAELSLEEKLNESIWYCPAGDGGVLAFATGGNGLQLAAETALALSVQASKDGLRTRISVSTGEFDLTVQSCPVGPAVLRGDQLSSRAKAAGIYADYAVWRELWKNHAPPGWKASVDKPQKGVWLVPEGASNRRGRSARSVPSLRPKVPPKAPETGAALAAKELMRGCFQNVVSVIQKNPSLATHLRDTEASGSSPGDADQLALQLLCLEVGNALQQLINWYSRHQGAENLEAITKLLQNLVPLGVNPELIKRARADLSQQSQRPKGGVLHVREGFTSLEAKAVTAAVHDLVLHWDPNDTTADEGFSTVDLMKQPDTLGSTPLQLLRQKILVRVSTVSKDAAEMLRSASTLDSAQRLEREDQLIATFLKNEWENGRPRHLIDDPKGTITNSLKKTHPMAFLLIYWPHLKDNAGEAIRDLVSLPFKYEEIVSLAKSKPSTSKT